MLNEEDEIAIEWYRRFIDERGGVAAMCARLKEIEDAGAYWMSVDDVMCEALRKSLEETGGFAPDLELAQKLNDTISALRVAFGRDA